MLRIEQAAQTPAMRDFLIHRLDEQRESRAGGRLAKWERMAA